MTTIRPATPEDYQGLCDVLEEVDALHRETLPHIFHLPQPYPPRSREVIQAWIDNGDTYLLIAEETGQIVGVNMVKIDSSCQENPIMTPRRFASIGPLVVCEGFQQRGIGKELMKQTIDWVIDHHPEVTHVELNVYEFNQGAIAFYRQLGFKTLARTMEQKLDR